MDIEIPYLQYPINHEDNTWSDWVRASITLDESGQVEAIRVVSPQGDITELAKPSPGVLRCLKPGTLNDDENDVYWLVLHEGGLYRPEYNARYKAFIKAKDMHKKTIAISSYYSALINLECFEVMRSQAAAIFYIENLKCPDNLPHDDERAPDEVITLQLLGDEVVERNQRFLKKCCDVYLRQVSSELHAVLATNQGYEARKASLVAFLIYNWKRVQASSLTYTATPQHPITMLLTQIAEQLGQADGKDAISYLMPGVYTTSLLEGLPDLNTIPLAELLKTHIIDSSHRYLLPVAVLLAHDTMPGEHPHPLHKGPSLLNPYYDNEDQDENAYISDSDLARLYHHSQMTKTLHDAHQHYQAAITAPSDLLGQLNILMPILRANDAHSGVGRDDAVGAGAYTAIMGFLAHYRQLNPIGLTHANCKPTLDNLGPGRGVEYVLVKAGEDAGLYCVNRHDNRISTLCDPEQKQRYPIHLLKVNNAASIPALEPSLSRDYPTLIGVESSVGVISAYHLYGRQGSSEPALWGFQSLPVDTRVRFPKENNRTILLALGHVPESLYTAIENSNAHLEPLRLIAHLSEAYPPCDTLTVEQLSEIGAHTGHEYLLEFKQVPESIRQQINTLSGYIQSMVNNRSATENLATCVGRIREGLEQTVSSHVVALSAIKLSEEVLHRDMAAIIGRLTQAREELKASLAHPHYTGIDPLPPTPQMLQDLGIPLVIETRADLLWLYRFPPNSLAAFLSDASNPGPKDYLQASCNSLEDIVILLIEAPAIAYKPLFEAIATELTSHVSTGENLRAILGALPQDKCIAVLEALKGRLPDIIKTGYDLGHALRFLNELQRTAMLEAMQERLPDIIKTGSQLGYALRFLNELQRTAVLEAMQERLTDIIKTGADLAHALRFLNELQRTAVLEAMQERLTDIIKTGSQLGYALRFLNELQRTAVLEAMQERLTDIIKTGEDLGDALRFLNELQCRMLLEALKGRLTDIIKTGYDLGVALLFLNELQCRMLLEAMQERLPDIIKTGTDLGRALQYLNELQCRMLLEAMQERLPDIIKTGADLGHALWFLNELQCRMLLEAMQARLPDIIKTGDDLIDALWFLNELQCRMLLEAMQERLPDIIKTGADLGHALWFLNELKCRMLLEAMQERLPDIIKTGADLGRLLEFLDEAQRTAVFDAYEKSNEFLDEAQRTAVFDAYKKSKNLLFWKAALSKTLTVAAVIGIGYTLFHYQAMIALLIQTVIQMPPALLVGLAILATSVLVYAAYHSFSMFNRPREKGPETLAVTETARI